jgi:hypothetical protein
MSTTATIIPRELIEGAWQRQNTPNGLSVARQSFNDYKAA